MTLRRSFPADGDLKSVLPACPPHLSNVLDSGVAGKDADSPWEGLRYRCVAFGTRDAVGGRL